MKIKQTKKLAFPAWLLITMIIECATVWFHGGVALAYTCHSSDYYDPATQTCHAYKKVDGSTTAAGTTVCPPGTDHQDPNGGACWAKGGTKQNYAPVQDNGQSVDPNSINCPRYGDIGGSGTETTYFYADRYSCCTHLNGPGLSNTIDPANCVDPTIPKQDPSAANNPQNQAKTCSDGSTPNAQGICANGQQATSPTGTASGPGNAGTVNGSCGQAKTNIISCPTGDSGSTVIGDVLKFGITALTVVIGIAAVGGIAWEAVQYARAQDNESVVSQARSRIRDIVIGLFAYGFMAALIEWLIPGMKL